VAGLLLLACGVRAWDQARVWRDSVSLFTHTLSVHPRSMAAFTNLGITLASWQGSPEGLDAALRTLPFAWEERPEEAGPGVPPQRRRQLLAALECFRRAVEYQPDVALNQYHLGAALVELHRPQDAVGPFQAAVRLHPPFAEAWFRLGTTLGQTPGREREAIDALTEAARLEPGNVEAHYIRAVLLGNRGKFAEAEAGFQAAARLAPGYADPHFGIGRMREKQDRLVEAIPEYQEAARLAPDNARFADALRDAERRAASDR